MSDVERVATANGGNARGSGFAPCAYGRTSTCRCFSTSIFDGQYQKMKAIAGGIIPQSMPWNEKIDQISHAHTPIAAANGQIVGSG